MSWKWVRTVSVSGWVLLGIVGCGGSDGPARYELSGSVTYRGQPVTAGHILFAPDHTQQNNGPGTHAEIENGRYQTLTGQGTIGGPHVVSISGSDGKPYDMGRQINPMGRPLFADYKVSIDLPRETATHDFVVPD